MYLITKWFGTFLYDNNKIKAKILFPKNAKEIVKRLEEIEKNNILTEEKKIIKGSKVKVNENRLESIGKYDNTDPFFKSININYEEYGYSLKLFNEVSVLLTQKKVDKQLKSEDLQIIQMVNALDDLIQTANLLSERISCWSLIYTKEEKILPFKTLLSKVNEEIKRLEQQIDIDMEKIAPNTSKIAGCLIGARLIAQAGGLQKLAMLPSSTIQILGAEKALFRFKKEGGKPPKHGIIFQNMLVNKALKKDRGKIARVFSGFISTAVKADVFTKNEIADNLIESLNIKINGIKNK